MIGRINELLNDSITSSILNRAIFPANKAEYSTFLKRDKEFFPMFILLLNMRLGKAVWPVLNKRRKQDFLLMGACLWTHWKLWRI